MQIRIFHIPVAATEEMTEELNAFLRSHKIVDIRKELATIDGNSCWTFCVTFMEQNNGTSADTSKLKGKIDYMKVLDPTTFEKFSSFRKIRKQIAEKEAVPAYVVFTDQDLAEIAKLPEITLQTLANLPGIGKGKLEKYGKYFCDIKEIQKNDEDEKKMPF